MCRATHGLHKKNNTFFEMAFIVFIMYFTEINISCSHLFFITRFIYYFNVENTPHKAAQTVNRVLGGIKSKV